MIQSHFHHLGIQSHHFPSQEFKAIFSSFRRSESFLSTVLGVQSCIHHLKAFRAVFSSFRLSKSFFFFSVLGVQSHVFSLVFRAISSVQVFKAISSSFRHSEPLSSILSVQSHVFSRGVQGHFFLFQACHFHQFQAFKSMSPVWHLESSSSLVWHLEPCLHLCIQSHCPTWHSVPPSLVQAFKAISYSFRHSKPLSSILGIQIHVFSLTFRAIIFFSLAFKVVSSFWHSESLSIQAFRVTMFLQFWRSELSCILIQAFRASLFLFWFKKAHVILEKFWWSFLFFGKVHFVSFVYTLALLVNSTEDGHICRP